METAIVIIDVLITLPAGLLQVMLLIWGLTAVAQWMFSFGQLRVGWLSLWGVWHLLVSILIFKFMHEAFVHDTGIYQTAVGTVKGLFIMIRWIILPLMTSLALSLLHLRMRQLYEQTDRS